MLTTLTGCAGRALRAILGLATTFMGEGLASIVGEGNVPRVKEVQMAPELFDRKMRLTNQQVDAEHSDHQRLVELCDIGRQFCENGELRQAEVALQIVKLGTERGGELQKVDTDALMNASINDVAAAVWTLEAIIINCTPDLIALMPPVAPFKDVLSERIAQSTELGLLRIALRSLYRRLSAEHPEESHFISTLRNPSRLLCDLASESSSAASMAARLLRFVVRGPTLPSFYLLSNALFAITSGAA